MATFDLTIVTPDSTAFEGTVEHLRARNDQGSFGVLAMHAPFLTILDVCCMEIRLPGNDGKALAVGGGCLEFARNKCTVLADSAQTADQIDVNAEQKSIQEYQARLQDPSEIDKQGMRLGLRRALNRVAVASQHSSR